MKISIFIFFTTLFLLLSLNSCKENKVPEAKKKMVIDPEKQSEFDNLVSAIDASTPSDSSSSLRFENEEFTKKQLQLYRYENISSTKWVLEEEKKNGKKRLTSFYFNNGKLFHSKEITFDDEQIFETNSYYNEKMEGIYSSNRTSNSYLDLDKAVLKPCDFVMHNFKECMEIKDAKGTYATKFVELIHFEGIDFLRVGKKSADGLWSDIIIPEMSDSIRNLEKSKANIGKKLTISFSLKNKNGFDFQRLESLSY
jgi:hypothetical protein